MEPFSVIGVAVLNVTLPVPAVNVPLLVQEPHIDVDVLEDATKTPLLVMFIAVKVDAGSFTSKSTVVDAVSEALPMVRVPPLTAM